MRHFNASPPRQVMVGVKFLLQLQRLVAGVGLSPSASESICTYNKDKEQKNLENRVKFGFRILELVQGKQ